MKETLQIGELATVVGVEGRRVSVFVDDEREAETRIALALNGEPVAATLTTVRKQDFARGLNLIRNGSFEATALPWRVVEGKGARLGRNRDARWHLSGGGTASLAIPAGNTARLRYAGDDNHDFIPVCASEHYDFEGYFGIHRCQASVTISLFDAEDGPITSYREAIPNKLGGISLGEYAKVAIAFAAPAQCTHVRIEFAIDQYVATNGGADAYLFFTHLAFGMANGGAWHENNLSADQIAALTHDAAVLEVTLPRASSVGIADRPKYEVIDRRPHKPAGGSPISFAAAPHLKFRASSFDGVTLAGEVSGAAGGETLELCVDGRVAARLTVTAGQQESRQIAMRVADSFLDGAPHVVELRGAATGTTLFLNAVTLKSLVTPWEALENFSRSPWPQELHPMARRRYVSLAAHMTALAVAASVEEMQASMQRAHQAGVSYEILTGKAAEQDFRMPLARAPQREPEVSVIVQAHDLWAAYRTMAALLFAYNETSSEVIVALDAPAEAAHRLTELVAGVSIVAIEPGESAARLCNRAAALARGRFIALLTAPAEPSAYWLDELRLSFDIFDNVGMAGAKLVRPNGRLVGAGGVVFTSGHRQIVGSNANAEHPQVNYTRQADYVALSAVLVAREAWDASEGLSEEFRDRDIESADFALKLRAQGRRVILAPHSVVTMAETDGHGSSAELGKSPAGLTRFKAKWADILSHQQPENTPLHLAMDKDVTGHILFIDQQVPRGDVDGGSYAAIQEIRLFQALGFKITFLPMNLTHLGVYTRALQRMGVEVIHAPFAISIEETLKERGGGFDLVYVTRHHVARAVLPLVRRHLPRAKVIFNNADLHFLRELRTALAEKNAELLKRSKLTRDQELDVMRKADLTLSYSDVEHAIIESHNMDETKVAKVPWVVEVVETIAPYSARQDIAFIGNFAHHPNADAVRFFAREVMPLVGARMPDVRFLIYGSEMTPEIHALQGGNVLVKGRFEDLAEPLAGARVFVAPLLSGAGLKGKVLSAMAHGVPCVLSQAAAEGIGAKAGLDYLPAQKPEEWADAICTLYADEGRWRGVSQSAHRFAQESYSFTKGVEILRRSLEAIDVFPPHKTAALCCRMLLPPLL